MVWSTVFSLLILFMRQCSAIPILSLVGFEYSNTCSDDYLVDREDFIVLEIASAENSSINRNKNACTGPQFFCTKKTKNNIINLCTAFDLVTNKCTNRKGEPNSCSCTEVTPNIEYRFTLNLTAYTYFSRQEVWMEWPGPPPIVSAHYQFPEIGVACAKIKFLRMQSSSNENKGFIVAEEDRTFIQFEVSGSNSVHSFKGIDGPQFYYTTIDGVSHKGCMGFEPSDGSCITRQRIRDACSCEMLTSNIYRLSYIKTATLNTSRATVYLLWPGKPDLRSDNYTFPEIRAKPSDSVINTEENKIFIGVGLVALLVTVAGVGIMCYKKYEARNSPFQARVPTDVRTQMETAPKTEIVENQQAAEDESINLDTSQDTVSSPTFATSV